MVTPPWRRRAVLSQVGVGEHLVDAELMEACQPALVKDLPAEGWLQWRGEGYPDGLGVERGIKTVELGVADAFGEEALHLHQGRGRRGRKWCKDPATVSRGSRGRGACCGCGCSVDREIGEQIDVMGFGVGEGVVLGDQHFLVLAVPAACPVFVGPAAAEGEIGLA